MKSSYRTSLAFTRFKDGDLLTFGLGLVNGMTANPNFPTPVVTPEELTTVLVAYRDATSQAENGGKLEIAARNAARAAFISPVRQLAAYVESIAGEDLTALLSSGFQPVTSNRTQIVLPKPVVLDLINDQSTKMALRLRAVPTARAYEVRISTGANSWQTIGIFTQSRKILLENLTPGVTYTVQVRAIGGLTGYSDWSDPVSHMSL
ncbi:MAG: fibronectin type III domain-containing protein [Verrucomicrobiota bacterium]